MIQHNIESLGGSTPATTMSLGSIHKKLVEGLKSLATNEVGELLKRSVLIELLLEATTDESAEMFRQLDEELMKSYV